MCNVFFEIVGDSPPQIRHSAGVYTIRMYDCVGVGAFGEFGDFLGLPRGAPAVHAQLSRAAAREPAEAEVTRMVLRPLGIGEGWAALRIGEWHTLRNVGAEPVSWLYVMR